MDTIDDLISILKQAQFAINIFDGGGTLNGAGMMVVALIDEYIELVEPIFEPSDEDD